MTCRLPKKFLWNFKEVALSYLFDIGGLVAGFMIAVHFGIFQLHRPIIAAN
jgi:hypothetical protein